MAKFQFAIALGVAGVLAYTGAELITTRVRAATSATCKPFVTKETFYKVTSEGEKVVGTAQIARREDTSDYIQRSPAGDQLAAKVVLSARILNFADGREVVVADGLEARTTIQKPAETVQQRNLIFSNQTSDCTSPVDTLEGRVSIFGLEAVRVSYIDSNDPLTRHTGVRLPDYACFEVERTEDHRASLASPWQTLLGMRTETFEAIAPDPTMFSGFDSYSELSPSGMLRAYGTKVNLSPQECPRCYSGSPIEDKRYLQLHK